MSTSPANEYFRTLLDASPDAMLVTDGDGVIVLVNTMALTLFGYRPGELEGHRIEVLIPKRYRGGHAAARARFEEETAPRRIRPEDLRRHRGDAARVGLVGGAG